MKREIILLRHAHADNAASAGNDVDRGLSPRGVAEARAAGHWLREHAALPATVLCSPARRARQTLEEALGDVPAQSEQRIYEATAGELAFLIDDHADVPRLMLVGHNPGFETLVALLATGSPEISVACRRAALPGWNLMVWPNRAAACSRRSGRPD